MVILLYMIGMGMSRNVDTDDSRYGGRNM